MVYPLLPLLSLTCGRCDRRVSCHIVALLFQYFSIFLPFGFRLIYYHIQLNLTRANGNTSDGAMALDRNPPPPQLKIQMGFKAARVVYVFVGVVVIVVYSNNFVYIPIVAVDAGCRSSNCFLLFFSLSFSLSLCVFSGFQLLLCSFFFFFISLRT